MEGERFWLLNIRRRRRIGMETQFRRPYLFDGSERLPHNNSLRSFVRWALNERKPKAETGASAKIERGEASAPRSLGGRRL